VSTRDLEEQLDNEDVPSDEAELELDDLDDEEMDLEDLDEEDDLLATDEDEEGEDADDEDEEDDEDDEDAVTPSSGREGSEPASLDQILAQKPDLRRALDDDDIMSVVAGKDDVVSEDLPSRIAPMRERQEFVCKSCFLVKSRAQLADKARQLCRDCI
jgi:hypothetical protein